MASNILKLFIVCTIVPFCQLLRSMVLTPYPKYIESCAKCKISLRVCEGTILDINMILNCQLCVMIWSLLYVSAQWGIRGCDRTSINGHYCCGHRWLIFGTGCLKSRVLDESGGKTSSPCGIDYEGDARGFTDTMRHITRVPPLRWRYTAALRNNKSNSLKYHVFYPFFTKWHFIISNSSAYWINFKSNYINIFKSHAIEICV